eukprot:1508029-Pleurochrysis_carterae.AAC.3
MRLELADPTAEQRVSFGAVHPHNTATRTVTLINRSKRELDVTVADADAALHAKCISLLLGARAHECVLRPREKTTLEIRFSPTARIQPFTEQVALRACGITMPLLILNGACVAMELQLEMDQLTFGQVVLNSRITRRLMLQNLGDMPSAFRLDKSTLEPDFSVSPMEGYLQPHEDVNLEVTFHPAAVNRDIRYERVPVHVDGQQPLLMTLTGMCVDATAESQTLSFKTEVREQTSHSIQVKNTSPTLWRIRPIVQDEQWTGAETLEVPAGQTASYELIYCPMVMTAEDAKHEGSVFFPLADGSAIYYKLEGVATAPLPAGTISQGVPCKQAASFPLAVANWMQQPQRFRVDISAPSADPSTQLSGHQYLDVPANMTRTYTLNFYAYKEGTTGGEVRFVNEKTGEYLWYQLNLKAEAPAVLKTIELQAPLRQLTTYDLHLANPLETPVTFKPSVDNKEVILPEQITVEPHGQGTFRIEWRPLLPSDKKSRLSVSSPELGAFLYDLNLTALPLAEQKALSFKVALGDAQAIKFRFFNYLRRQETYKLSLSSGSDFEVESSVVAPAAADSNGTEVAVDVVFEPSKLGEAVETLTVTSAEGGEYTCSLHGQSLPPKPQGPIVIKAGSTAQARACATFAQEEPWQQLCSPKTVGMEKRLNSSCGKARRPPYCLEIVASSTLHSSSHVLRSCCL